MGSEVLLYGYGLICLSMIVFNLVYRFVTNKAEARLVRRCARFKEEIDIQLSNISHRKPVDDRHIARLRRRLSNVNALRAFDHALEERIEHESQAAWVYMEQLQPVILHLSTVYCRRDGLQAAYFAFFLYRHQPQKYMQMDAVQDVLLEYMKKDSLYCRVNALKALCAFGSPERIVKAVAIQDRGGGFLHEKLLTECLLDYDGDADRLIAMCLEEMEKFTIRTQRALLDFIRFKSGDYKQQMLAIMTDPTRDRELRFSAIRYFGRYPYPPAREHLLVFLKEVRPEQWEYAAISATALAAYPGIGVVNALVEAMYSDNWYIRYNASASLEAQGLRYSDLPDLVGGRDRYAREMLMYRLERRKLRTAQEAETASAGNKRDDSEGRKETVWA